jgi:hypothetical protein
VASPPSSTPPPALPPMPMPMPATAAKATALLPHRQRKLGKGVTTRCG